MLRTIHLALLVTSLTQCTIKVCSHDTAALIIAGLIPDGVDESGYPLYIHTSSVELFGCPGRSQDSYPVDDYPFPNYFSASIFTDDYALSCGGFSCERDTCDGSTNKCFSWRPRDDDQDQWQEHSVMYEKNWNFIIAEGPDLDSEDTSRMTLITIGPSRNTQIYSPDDNTWRFYRVIPESSIVSWGAHRCVMQVGTDVYHIEESIVKLSLIDWEITILGTDVPFPSNSFDRCISQTINGRLGILLSNGFWYDIDSDTWEQRAYRPDADFIVESPYNEYNFRGKMTIFGNQLCNSEGYCEYLDVVQYDVEQDIWSSIGQMYMQREVTDVVEVPIEWCDDILGPPSHNINITGRSIIAEPKVPDSPLAVQGADSVAMILGGISGGDESVKSVELFGCPGYQSQSLAIQDYPLSVYLTGGSYIKAEDHVLVCGGMACADGSQQIECASTTECYTYNPINGWKNFTSLQKPRWQHIVASIINVDESTGELHPAIIGNGMETEIYNSITDAWEEYKLLPEALWKATECLIQDGDYLYYIKNAFTKFDTSTWAYEELDLPSFLAKGDTCSIVQINGSKGESSVF